MQPIVDGYVTIIPRLTHDHHWYYRKQLVTQARGEVYLECSLGQVPTAWQILSTRVGNHGGCNIFGLPAFRELDTPETVIAGGRLSFPLFFFAKHYGAVSTYSVWDNGEKVPLFHIARKYSVHNDLVKPAALAIVFTPDCATWWDVEEAVGRIQELVRERSLGTP